MSDIPLIAIPVSFSQLLVRLSAWRAVLQNLVAISNKTPLCLFPSPVPSFLLSSDCIRSGERSLITSRRRAGKYQRRLSVELTGFSLSQNILISLFVKITQSRLIGLLRLKHLNLFRSRNCCHGDSDRSVLATKSLITAI